MQKSKLLKEQRVVAPSKPASLLGHSQKHADLLEKRKCGDDSFSYQVLNSSFTSSFF